MVELGSSIDDCPQAVRFIPQIWYDMIYLTVIGLTLGGSSTIHIYTQTIHRTTQSTQTIHRTIQLVRTVPRLCEVYPGICLTTEEKARKILSQGSRKMPVGKQYTEQMPHFLTPNIEIYN